PEGLAPLDADSVEMRVRHRDAVKASARPHRRDARVIDESEAIPQDVARRSLDEQRPLADADRWIGADPGQARLELAHLDPTALPTELVQRNPALSLGWNILPFVVADGAICRRTIARRLLHPAGPAD